MLADLFWITNSGQNGSQMVRRVSTAQYWGPLCTVWYTVCVGVVYEFYANARKKNISRALFCRKEIKVMMSELDEEKKMRLSLQVNVHL